jgi:hypothetical protein
LNSPFDVFCKEQNGICLIPIIQENSRNVNSTGQNHKGCLFFPIIAVCGKADGKNPFLYDRSAGKEKFGNKNTARL